MGRRRAERVGHRDAAPRSGAPPAKIAYTGVNTRAKAAIAAGRREEEYRGRAPKASGR